jgi:sortase A
MRKFKRRRRQASFVLLISLVIIVLGITLFFRTDPFQRTGGTSTVDRISVPMIAQAPEAVAEQTENKERSQGKGAAVEDNSQGKGAAVEDKKEQATAEEPVAPVPKTNDLWMTIPKMDLYDNYVSNSNAESALDYGAAKRTDTEFPWQQGDTNTYISAHRVGWPGTASNYQFYDLPLLTFGDKIYLYDANGTTYTYEVTEIFEVMPTETWVTEPVRGTDVITLQTCIENWGDYWTMGPNWYVRYVVRADRVAATPA